MISIPFSGSKRYCYKDIKQIVEQGNYSTVFEPFGGSCVLSVNLFKDGLVKNAVVNDFDDIFTLYPKFLDLKDEIVKKCLDHGIVKTDKKPLPKEQQEYLQSLISEIDPKYYLLLSHNFVFSGQRCSEKNIKVSGFRYFMNNLDTADQREYLKVINKLERTSVDFRDFFKMFKNRFDENSLIIINPPYLNSAQKQYTATSYFGLTDTVDLMRCIKAAGCDVVLFNTNERDIKTLLELFDLRASEILTHRFRTSSAGAYNNVMAYIRA